MSQSPFVAPSPASLGSLLPAFDFTSVIESDGRGAVYFGEQKSLERQVAVKLFPSSPGNGPFENVTKAVAGLKHPNLIGIFDSGKVEGMPYLVMEFVPGKSLARSTKGQAIDPDLAMTLMGGICDGLAHAHEKGIVHGSLDPSGILLNQDAQPKIGNFGRGHRDDGGEVSDLRSACSAPEIRDGSGKATTRSDVYSLGAIFHELIHGSPFNPDSAPPPALTRREKEMAAVIGKATDPDPANRMPDARAFHDALLGKAEEKPKSARPAGARTPDVRAVASKPAPVPKVGFDWKLVRNLAIIIGLLFGIHLAWENLKDARANREKANREILAKSAAKREEALAEALRNRRQQAAGNVQDARPERTTPAVVPRAETPEESLERLRQRLLSGDRSEMPVGAVKRGDSDYFLVSHEMGWAEAALLAEQYGGHLAVTEDAGDMDWMAAEVSKGRSWIGVARSGTESWVTVSGKVWSPSEQPGGGGTFLAVDQGGLLVAESAAKRHPFVIQWHSDGSNPGTLANRLAATRSSLAQPSPVFPPGTVAHDGRFFLQVPRVTTWEEADVLAESAGGHLAVVSTVEEAAYLRKLTADQDAGNRFWLGGRLENSQWRWVTGEPWTTADWTDDADGGSHGAALVICPGRGWDSRDPAETSSGFIIEWSADSSSAGKRESGTGEAGGEVAGLLAKAGELIAAAERTRNEALAANIKKLKWDLDAFVKGQNSSGQAQWGPQVKRLKNCVEDDRLMREEALSKGIRFSAEMAKIAEYAVRKQGEIDAKFNATAGTIRDSFIAKMAAIQEGATESGQIKVAKTASEAIGSAQDLEAWIENIGNRTDR